MAKHRVDELLVARKLVTDLDKAQRLVMAGQVRAGGQVVAKASTLLAEDVALEVDWGPRFVSRGGEKLQAALETFGLTLSGNVCADVGASTGGFTDCLLQHGAARVYAIDVGKGQLDWRLRQDARAVVMEGSNARHIESLPQAIDLVTVDASFISLKALLLPIRGWLTEEGNLIALIKPQFEATKEEATRGQGVIRDLDVHRRILQEILEFTEQAGYRVAGLIRSPITGPKGNVEFLMWAKTGPVDQALKIDRLIQAVLESKGS